MTISNFKVYRTRWFMLIIYMLMVAVNQLLWITFAPITGDATRYYGVSDLKIGILSMSFMIVYVVVSIPASEGTSNGMLLMIGQVSGIAFIFGMDSMKSSQTGSMTRSLVILIVLMVLSILMSFRLGESTILRKQEPV